LPGFSASARSLAALGEALAGGPGLIGLDLRGRGLSDKPETGYGLDQHVVDVLALLDAQGIERAPVIGHSFGALLGLLLAARHPERVERLVLVDGAAPVPEYIHTAVEALIRRLDLTFPSIDALLGVMRAAPFLQPWNAYLEAYFRSEAEPLPGGIVRFRPK